MVKFTNKTINTTTRLRDIASEGIFGSFSKFRLLLPLNYKRTTMILLYIIKNSVLIITNAFLNLLKRTEYIFFSLSNYLKVNFLV
jgi:hypothetical protein